MQSAVTATRVLVIDDNPAASTRLASFLASRHYDVHDCAGIADTSAALTDWRPDVFVLASRGAGRHGMLASLRRRHPRVPVVVVTDDGGPDVLLDIEAFAPATTVDPRVGLSGIESTVRAIV